MTNSTERRSKKRCSTCHELKPLDHFYRRKERHQAACKVCQRVYRHKYPRPSESVEWRRELRLRKFGMSLDAFLSLQEALGRRCQICGARPKGHLSADHCHATNRFRGLLCSACNLGLGHFRDDIKSLQNAILYLLKHEEEE